MDDHLAGIVRTRKDSPRLVGAGVVRSDEIDQAPVLAPARPIAPLRECLCVSTIRFQYEDARRRRALFEEVEQVSFRGADRDDQRRKRFGAERRVEPLRSGRQLTRPLRSWFRCHAERPRTSARTAADDL
jgi:hypothetical protein